MAIPERDTVYNNETTNNRSVYASESSSTGWFVGIIVALALLAIGYLVFSANSTPTTVDVNNTPIIEAPAPAPAVEPAPMVEAPAPAETPAPAAEPAPATTPEPATAPATEPAPATTPEPAAGG